MEDYPALFNIPKEKTVYIERENLAEQLYKIFQNISLNDFVQLFTNEFEELFQYLKLSHGHKACQKTSLLFNPQRLDTITKGSVDSVYSSLKRPTYVNGLARAILFMGSNKLLVKEDTRNILYSAIGIGVNSVQYINEFPPHVAVELCKIYTQNKSDKVLDPCGGWGGRMIGTSVVTENYTCFEPATRTYTGLINLFNFIKKLNPDFTAEINNLPFEEAHLEQNSFDFALTSPPYYDTEVYTDEDTNSANRYKTFESWCTEFYIPLIEKTMSALKPGKTFVLNIGSRRYPIKKVLMKNFRRLYTITKLKPRLSGQKGLGKKGEGETLYAIQKPE